MPLIKEHIPQSIIKANAIAFKFIWAMKSVGVNSKPSVEHPLDRLFNISIFYFIVIYLTEITTQSNF